MKYVHWESIKGKASGIDTEENFAKWSTHENARGKYRVKKRFESDTVPAGYNPPVSREQKRELKKIATDNAIKAIRDDKSKRVEERKARMNERGKRSQTIAPTPPEALEVTTPAKAVDVTPSVTVEAPPAVKPNPENKPEKVDTGKAKEHTDK